MAELSSPGRLLQKQPALLDGALVLGAPAADRKALGARRYFTFQAGPAEPALERGTLPAPGSEQTVVLYAPKGSSRRRMMLRIAAAHLAETGGTIALVGEKKGGIKAARTDLRNLFGQCAVAQVGYHCQLLTARVPSSDTTTASFQLAEFQLAEHMTGFDTGLGFDAFSLPGTFAEGRLDVGTARLLEVWSPPTEGRLLDLACGAGPIGVWAKRKQPNLEVVLSDVDHLAIASATETAHRANANVQLIASDGYDAITGPNRFDQIVSNPPFHQGLATNHEVPERFVRQAPQYLTPNGSLWIVANHFLPYEGWMRETFSDVKSVMEDKRFKVLRASKAR